MVSAYIYSALTKSTQFHAAVVEQASLGLHPAAFFAVLTIAVEAIGSALILTGRLVWIGAGMLGVFTGLTIVVAHAFWTLPAGSQRFLEINSFFEHLGLVAGFALIAVVAYHQDRPPAR